MYSEIILRGYEGNQGLLCLAFEWKLDIYMWGFKKLLKLLPAQYTAKDNKNSIKIMAWQGKPVHGHMHFINVFFLILQLELHYVKALLCVHWRYFFKFNMC